MKKSLISVIIPTHNSEKYIEECINSVVNQTYKNLEIICVDSSSDSTVDILDKFKSQDERVQIIQDENNSYGHKLNVGIRKAKGDYIAIVESDDYILPEMYEDMLEGVTLGDVDFIKSAANYFVNVGERRVFVKDQADKIKQNTDRIIDIKDNPDIVWMDFPRIWTALYRKNFLLENGIWANETPAASFQDTSFAILVSVFAKKCMYRAGGYYCYRNDNINSSVKSSAKVFCVCDEYKYVKEKLRGNVIYTKEMQEKLLRVKLSNYIWNLLRLSEKSGEEFRNGIEKELLEYTPEMIAHFDSNEKLVLEAIKCKESFEEYKDSIQKKCDIWNRVIDVIVSNEECVLIGSGILGKKMLWLQEFFGKKCVQAIGDNNYLNFKDEVEGYKVESVEDVVRKHSELNFIIANKNHGEEILDQLVNLDVSKAQILVVNEAIGKIALFKEAIKRLS